MTDPAGRKVARYEIEAELARGGMGVVYLAQQPALGRPVVLKALLRDLHDDPREERRFEREAQAVAAVHHPNVVGVYDCFRWRGRLFIAQEYVDGIDLGSALSKIGPFAPRAAALVALEIARGLEEIHGRGLVHRDLKPGNVLLGRAGDVKIADFGVALDARGPALTRTGLSLGTPAYMSPEQIQGARLDFRSDVFAFGVLLYEILSAKLPFGMPAEESEPLLQRIEAGRLRSLRRAAPGTPRALVRLVRRCLQAPPKRRAESASDLRRQLERNLGSPSPADARAELAAWLEERKAFPGARGRTVRAARAEPPEPTEATPRTLARRLALAAGLALLLLAGGATWWTVDEVGASVASLGRLQGSSQGLSAERERKPAVSAARERKPAVSAAPATVAASSPAGHSDEPIGSESPR